jgi:hypothetical protein
MGGSFGSRRKIPLWPSPSLFYFPPQVFLAFLKICEDINPCLLIHGIVKFSVDLSSGDSSSCLPFVDFGFVSVWKNTEKYSRSRHVDLSLIFTSYNQ